MLFSEFVYTQIKTWWCTKQWTWLLFVYRHTGSYNAKNLASSDFFLIYLSEKINKCPNSRLQVRVNSNINVIKPVISWCNEVNLPDEDLEGRTVALFRVWSTFSFSLLGMLLLFCTTLGLDVYTSVSQPVSCDVPSTARSDEVKRPFIHTTTVFSLCYFECILIANVC